MVKKASNPVPLAVKKLFKKNILFCVRTRNNDNKINSEPLLCGFFSTYRAVSYEVLFPCHTEPISQSLHVVYDHWWTPCSDITRRERRTRCLASVGLSAPWYLPLVVWDQSTAGHCPGLPWPPWLTALWWAECSKGAPSSCPHALWAVGKYFLVPLVSGIKIPGAEGDPEERRHNVCPDSPAGRAPAAKPPPFLLLPPQYGRTRSLGRCWPATGPPAAGAPSDPRGRAATAGAAAGAGRYWYQGD